MKDEWEVYFESVEAKIGELTALESPLDPEGVEYRAIVAAFEEAHTSTVEVLIHDDQWSRVGAVFLVQEFYQTSRSWLDGGQQMGLPGLRLRLRHRYEDWLRQ